MSQQSPKPESTLLNSQNVPLVKPDTSPQNTKQELQKIERQLYNLIDRVRGIREKTA
jgi:hypothetical protein